MKPQFLSYGEARFHLPIILGDSDDPNLFDIFSKNPTTYHNPLF